MKRGLILLFLMFIWVLPAYAQETDTVIIGGDGGELNRDDIKAAAQPLLDRGAKVVVYFVKEGGKADFYSRLDEEGFTRQNGIFVDIDNLVAIYVSLNRYSEILVGDTWADELPARKLETIRQDSLNPSLRTANYSTAFSNTLTALESGIANPGSTTGFAPYSYNYDYGVEETNEFPTSLLVCGIVVFFILMMYLQMAYPEWFENSYSDDGSYRPRHSYKSSWRSSSSSSRSSFRSSGSSGRGSRSGGSW